MSVSSFRTQIIETQKARSDLMKWKLLLVAGLGSAGIGMQKLNLNEEYLLLALIPLVCVYVDALCAHLSLRITAIGEFIRSQEPVNEDQKYARDYENFLKLKPPNYGLEQLALHWSTGCISAVIAGAGMVLLAQGIAHSPVTLAPYFTPIAMIASGLTGIAITILIRFFDMRRRKILRGV